MNYFQIKCKTPKGGMGEFIKGYLQNGSIYDKSYIGNLYQYERIEFQPIIPKIEIGINYAIPDLFIPGGPISGRFIVSTYLKNYLDKHDSNNFIQYFPITILQNGNQYNDFWITQFLSFKNELIDFEKSIFTEKVSLQETSGLGKTKRVTIYKDLRFDSIQELLERTDLNYSNSDFLFGKNLFLKESCALDVVLLEENLSCDIIVSENLKDKIEKMNFNGLLFKPLEWSDKDWFDPNSPLKQVLS